MANALNFYNPIDWKLNASVTLADGASDITGVYFDDYYFWTTREGGEVGQWYLANDGTLAKVSSFDLSSLPDFLALEGITGDRRDLYIAWQNNICFGGPPPLCTSSSNIYKYDKNGNYLDSIYSNTSTGGVGFADLAMDEKYLVICDSFATDIKRVEPISKKLVHTTSTLARTFYGLDCKGNGYYGIRNTGHGHELNIDGTLQTPQVATSISPRGLCFSRAKLNSRGFDWSEGQWVVVGAR